MSDSIDGDRSLAKTQSVTSRRIIKINDLAERQHSGRSIHASAALDLGTKPFLAACLPTKDKSSHFRPGNNGSSSVFESRSEAKVQRTQYYELYRNFPAILLASSVLVLSYNGARYGRSEYSLLEDGQTVSGSLPSNSAVITLSLGYSTPYSIVSSIAAIMLLYSLVSKKARWSLPSMVLCMADLVCDVGDAVVAIWLFFGGLQATTAILYSIGTVVIILAEFWIWLGVLQLYENRTSIC